MTSAIIKKNSKDSKALSHVVKYVLDAENKKVGRIATQAAIYLMGKNLTSFARNTIPEVKVEIKNAGKAAISDKKYDLETIAYYSGYPGGLRKPTARQVAAKHGNKELFKEAVWGMLPKNKLRQKMMNNLTITE